MNNRLLSLAFFTLLGLGGAAAVMGCADAGHPGSPRSDGTPTRGNAPDATDAGGGLGMDRRTTAGQNTGGMGPGGMGGTGPGATR